MTSHALASFWKCYEQLPANIQKLADKQFALFKANPRHPSLGFRKKGGVTPSRSVGATVHWLASETVITTGSGSAPTSNTIGSSSRFLRLFSASDSFQIQH